MSDLFYILALSCCVASLLAPAGIILASKIEPKKTVAIEPDR